MNNLNDIDELLRNSFGNFEATPPSDAWSGIQQGLSHAGTGGGESAVTKTATVVKSAGIITKVAIIAVTSGIIIGGGYVTYKYFQKNPETKTSVQQIQAPQKIEEKLDKNISSQNQYSIEKNTKATLPLHQKENKKVISNPEVETNTVVNANENRPASANTANTVVNTPKTIFSQVPKTTQKPVLPKPNHNAVAPGKVSSNANNEDENNFVKPEIPNAITPDGDGLNDTFIIKIENETYYDLKIYDKEYRLVFASDNKEKVWNGTNMNMGEPCDAGVYYYSFSYRNKNSDKVIPMRGTITLIR